jgi:ketosteroid isomerase-like protein
MLNTMFSSRMLFLSIVILLIGCNVHAQAADLEQLEQQVGDTERAFAQSMADRDHAAFVNFLSDEAVFFNGETPLVGKQTVADTWAPYFEKPEAPFSWEPETVVVLQSGTLAHSSGPVRTPDGKVVARFNSVWRLESPGVWRIVFDKGSPVCSETASPEAANP